MKYQKEKDVEEKLKEISYAVDEYISGSNLLKAWMHTPGFSINNNKLIDDLMETADEAMMDIYKLFGNPCGPILTSTLATAFAKWQCNYTTITTIFPDIIDGRLLDFVVDSGKEIQYGTTTNIKLIVAGDADVSSFEINIITKLNIKKMLGKIFNIAFLDHEDYIMEQFSGFNDDYSLDITGLIKDYEAKAEFDRASYFNKCKNTFGNAVINTNTIKEYNGDYPPEPDLVGNQYITFVQFVSNINNVVKYPYSLINKYVFNQKILYNVYGLIHECPFGMSDKCYIIGTCKSAETCPIRDIATTYEINDLDDSDIDHILKSTAVWNDITRKFSSIKAKKDEDDARRKDEEERIKKELQRKLAEEKYNKSLKDKEEEKERQEKINRDNQRYNEILKEEKESRKNNIIKEITARRKNYVLGDIGDEKCPILGFTDDFLEITPGGFKITMLLDYNIPRYKQREYIGKLDLYHICLDKFEMDVRTHKYRKKGEKEIADTAIFYEITNTYVNLYGTELYIVFEIKKKLRELLLDIMVDEAVKKQFETIGKKDKVYIAKDKRKALRAHILFNFNLNAVKFKDKDQIVEDIIDILNKYYNDITKENVDKAIQYLLDHYLIINDLKSFNLEEELVAVV